MRALWRGEEVSHRGHVVVDRARLWSLPDEPPQLIGGAMSVETAAWAAEWADGLITTNHPLDKLRRIVDAYRGAGGRGSLRLQHLAYALRCESDQPTDPVMDDIPHPPAPRDRAAALVPATLRTRAHRPVPVAGHRRVSSGIVLNAW